MDADTSINSGQKKPDKEHPYGHQRMEYIAGFIVSVIVCVLGVQLILEAIDKIRNPGSEVSYFYLNMVILCYAIIIILLIISFTIIEYLTHRR